MPGHGHSLREYGTENYIELRHPATSWRHRGVSHLGKLGCSGGKGTVAGRGRSQSIEWAEERGKEVLVGWRDGGRYRVLSHCALWTSSTKSLPALLSAGMYTPTSREA